MNCIDAIEGNVKQIISRLHDVSVRERFEDSEYVRCVKIILEATDAFLSKNKEVTDEPGILYDILLTHAKELWMGTATTTDEQDNIAGHKHLSKADREYLVYYFDNLYHQGDFPL